MVENLNEQQIVFLKNRLGEPIGNLTVPKHVQKWADDEHYGVDEEGYIVVFNGQYGFLLVEEYSHDEQDDKDEKTFALENNLKSEDVLKELKAKAEGIKNTFEEGIIPMVGCKTGVMMRHGLAVFFPVGTPEELCAKCLDFLLEFKPTA